MHTDTKLIPLTQGKSAIVDAADYEWLSQFKWYAQRTAPSDFYARCPTPMVSGKRSILTMHRIILDAPRGAFVDHINHNGLDNRRANLRLCSHAENMRNQRSVRNSTSKYLGVTLDVKGKRWRSYIRINGRVVALGSFRCEIEAAQAYDCAAREHHGEFANPNFPIVTLA